MPEPLSDDELAFLQSSFELARTGDTGALAAAVFRQEPDSVTALLDAGADPHLGERSAVAIASFFELPEMLLLLQAPRG